MATTSLNPLPALPLFEREFCGISSQYTASSKSFAVSPSMVTRGKSRKSTLPLTSASRSFAVEAPYPSRIAAGDALDARAFPASAPVKPGLPDHDPVAVQPLAHFARVE